MPIPKTTRIHSLFDDSDPIPADQHNESLRSELPWLKFGLIGCAVLIGFAIAWNVRLTSEDSKATQLELVGARAGQLQPGATVIIGGVRIGSVIALTYENQQAVATLQIDPNVATQLTSDTRFFVRPIGSTGHSSIGVEAVVGKRVDEALPKRIEITEESSLKDWVREQLPSNRSASDEERLETPTKWNWSAIAGSIATLAMVITASVRLLRSLLPVVILCLVVIATDYILMHLGILPIDWSLHR